MKLLHSLLLFLLLQINVFSLQSTEEIQHLTFTPPKGWIAAEAKQLPSSVKMMFLGKSKELFPPSLNLSVETYQGTLKEYLATVAKINLELGSEWEDLGAIQVPAGEASLSQVDTETEWGKLKLMHLILVKHGHAFVLTAAALKEDFSNHYEEFFKSFKSLAFTSK